MIKNINKIGKRMKIERKKRGKKKKEFERKRVRELGPKPASDIFFNRLWNLYYTYLPFKLN